MSQTVLRSGLKTAAAISASASPLAIVPDAVLVNATATFTCKFAGGADVTITSVAPGVLPISPSHVTVISSGTLTALYFER
jgi:hypothetical protein